MSVRRAGLASDGVYGRILTTFRLSPYVVASKNLARDAAVFNGNLKNCCNGYVVRALACVR
jgi:hypothetical protein